MIMMIVIFAILSIVSTVVILCVFFVGAQAEREPGLETKAFARRREPHYEAYPVKKVKAAQLRP